jgi:DNA polymerase-3 subunit epsilon
MPFPASSQPSLDDLGRLLPHATFCVVDLETTGGASDDTITEIGAVKVRGGEVLGEFQTLVNPLTHIPALIAVLTGITNQMVAGSPTLGQVLPAFMEFAAGSVLVAHNARFDVGFLKRACEAHSYHWPSPEVIDTVALARHALLRDEVPNCKLATLARHFRVAEAPNHRALTDARATVEVLHALIERVGNLGVNTVEDLLEFTRQVSPGRRAKRQWAQDLPQTGGIYYFVSDTHDPQGHPQRQVLYVGKSLNLARRVRTYFTAAEKRPRIDEMVRVATGVEYVECATSLQADVLELRLIAAHAPRYNGRSKFPERQLWLKLTREPFPRLSIVRVVADDRAHYFGPFSRRSVAEQTLLALHDAFPIRQCTTRLSARRPSAACALAELGRCRAPCELAITPEAYALITDEVRRSLTMDVRPVLEAVRPRLRQLVRNERFEDAATLTSRLESYTRTALRHHRVASLAGCPQIVAAYRTGAGWEIHVIRHGRLAAALLARPGEVPQAVARAAVAVAEAVPVPRQPLPAATIEETERIADWLERPGVRLIEIEGTWSWPLHIGLAEGDLARHALGTLAG